MLCEWQDQCRVDTGGFCREKISQQLAAGRDFGDECQQYPADRQVKPTPRCITLADPNYSYRALDQLLSLGKMTANNIQIKIAEVINDTIVNRIAVPKSLCYHVRAKQVAHEVCK